VGKKRKGGKRPFHTWTKSVWKKGERGSPPTAGERKELRLYISAFYVEGEKKKKGNNITTSPFKQSKRGKRDPQRMINLLSKRVGGKKKKSTVCLCCPSEKGR